MCSRSLGTSYILVRDIYKIYKAECDYNCCLDMTRKLYRHRNVFGQEMKVLI